MSKNIKFNIKLSIDGKEQLVVATTGVNGLKRAIQQTEPQATKLRNGLINFNQVSQVFENISASVNSLTDFIGKLSETYNNVQQANTQLTTVMRQRMDATDADIKKVNEVISAQSKLGVVSGTAQKIGAQQVATFLKQKGTLEQLIPAMNNLIAQQRGVNATQEDARSVANLMGKAMTGQTAALRKVGITFTAAQERILKYGDEQQRAAMLAQVITDNVGNMNAELGKTNAGRIKHAEMQFAKIKISIGEAVSKLQPFVAFVAQSIMIVASVGTLANSFRALSSVMNVVKIKTALLTVVQKIWNSTSYYAALATKRLQASFIGASISATTMKIALRGLMITTGIGIAIAALGVAIEYFVNRSDKASASTSRLAYAQNILKQSAKRTKDAFDQTNGQTFSDLMASYAKMQAAWKSLASTQKPAWIIRNRDELKKLGLNVKTVADAENVFVKNTDKVVDAFKARARAAARLAMLTEEYKLQMELTDKISQKNEQANQRHKKKEGDMYIAPNEETFQRDKAEGNIKSGGVGNWQYTKKGADRFNANYKWIDNGAEARAYKTALATSKKRAAQLEKQTVLDAKRNTSITPNIADNKTKKALAGSVDWYEQRLTTLHKKITATPNIDIAKGLQNKYKKVEEKLKALKIKIGLEKPDKKKTQTYMEKLKKQLEEAQKTFDDATTVEARVKAATNIASIQQQINEASTGKLTIQAEIAPTYIQQSGDDDKRQSYENAKRRAERIKSDVEIGLIGKPEAMQQLNELNKLVEKLGLKPVKIEFDTTEADKAKMKMKAATDAVGQMGSSLSGLGNEIGVPELNIAGTMAQAIATMVAGYATASSEAGASMGPWGWIAFAALGLAQLGAMIASVKGMAGSYATGGIIGGNSFSGDRLTARVNSGEMILNARQQARLFKLASGGITPVMAAPRPVVVQTPSVGGTIQNEPLRIELGVSGRNLTSVMENERRIARRKTKSRF
jgi:hypothetical protein|nr:MAG TPA: putative tail length tape measure protein [Caudoviricetes sp.]